MPKYSPTLDRFYSDGLSARMWYDDAWAFLQEEFQGHAYRMAAYLAMTSPNATVQANVTLALKALRHYKSGQEFSGYLKSVTFALKTYEVHGVVLGGPKIRCFYENLTGNLTPVTVDRWIARALGAKSNPKTEIEYMQMSLAIAEFARAVGEEPARAQAAIWHGIRHAEQVSFNFGDMKELLWAKTRQLTLEA